MLYILDFYWPQDAHRSLEFGSVNCNPFVEDQPHLMKMDGDLRWLWLMQLQKLQEKGGAPKDAASESQRFRSVIMSAAGVWAPAMVRMSGMTVRA